MSERDDALLYRQVQEKDKGALETLYTRYEKLLYSFSFRLIQDSQLSEEIVQEVFIKLWKGQGTYDESKGKFSSWLLTITRNTAIDLIRRKKKLTTIGIEDRDSLQSIETPIEEALEWKEEGDRIRTAISKLKEEQQAMIDLFYFKGFTQQKISEKFGIPLGTVKGRIRLALKHLRSHLEVEGGIDYDK